MTTRRAFTILEVSVATVILAVLLAASLKFLHVMSNNERASERRALALQAVQAVSEQAGNLPWDELATEGAQAIDIPRPINEQLPDAKLTIEVADERMPVVSKRIVVELTWSNVPGKLSPPARLTSWAFPEAQSKE